MPKNQNRIDAKLTPAQQAKVLSLIEQIRVELPFLIDLSSEERQGLLKAGDKSMGFIRAALDLAARHPDFLPRSFDLDEMRRDTELTERLYPVLAAARQSLDLLEDTFALASSEAYAAALVVYRYAQDAGAGEGLEATLDRMAARFSRKGRGKDKDKPAEPK